VEGGRRSTVVADDTIAEKLDIDLIAFGAWSNLSTLNVFDNQANQFVAYNPQLQSITSKQNGKKLCNPKKGFDYGVILKIHPVQFPQRTWLVCAGMGESGTSGSAWYLAHRWREIAKNLKGSDQFACIVEVENGKDESAVPRLFLNRT
jgi:hypothetical protein